MRLGALSVTIVLAVSSAARAGSPPAQRTPPTGAGPRYLVFYGGLVDVGRGLVFYNAPPDRPLASAQLLEASKDRFFESVAGSRITAIRIDDGTEIWSAQQVSTPLYLHDDKLLVHAAHEGQVVLGVIDVNDGQLLRRIPSGVLGVVTPISPDPCDEGPVVVAGAEAGGQGVDFHYRSSFRSCPEESYGGVRRSDEELARSAARCSSVTNLSALNLATGKSRKLGQGEFRSAPLLYHLPSLTQGGVRVTHAGGIRGWRVKDEKLLWTIEPFSRPEPRRECPSKPRLGR